MLLEPLFLTKHTVNYYQVMKSKKNILVIEDHKSIRLLLGTMLSKHYSVVTTKNGMEGMAWLGKGNIPDLILLDMSMPQLTGQEFLSNIRCSGFFKDIPVVVISGEDSPKAKKQCYQLGIREYFTKPFNPIKLNQSINYILQPNNQAQAA